MEKSEVNKFNTLYEEYLRALKLQGKAKKPLMLIQGQSAGSGIILIFIIMSALTRVLTGKHQLKYIMVKIS